MPSTLRHYNKIPTEQRGELDQGIMHVEARFRHAYEIPPFIDVSPAADLRNLAKDLATQT